MIVYISIGNSDDKLTQADWAGFIQDVHDAANDAAIAMHGEWFSAPASPWQNACWCVELHDPDAFALAGELGRLCAIYGQDSIAWAEVAKTEFLSPEAPVPGEPTYDEIAAEKRGGDV